jgi:large subunit ribosomal protein L17
MALFRNLVTELLKHERIITTEAKAREVKGLAEKMITLGKRGDLHSRRQAIRFVYDRKIVDKIFDELGPRYADRPGGYSRMVKIGQRQGDGARMAQLELVGS